MAPLLRHLTSDLLNSIHQIQQFLTPTINRRTRNVIGDIISSLTGLATQEQLRKNLLDTGGESDQNLLHIADLARNQDSIHTRIEEMSAELNSIYEVTERQSFNKITRVLQLTSYALQLIFLTTEYKVMWSDIASSITNEHSNHHTIPLPAILEARTTFLKYYGSKNYNTRFGITHNDQFLHIPTMAQSSVQYFLHIKPNQTQLITQIDIPIFQHGYRFHPISDPISPGSWLIVNSANTEGIVVTHSHRSNMHIYHDTTFLTTREVRITTHQTSCFLNIDNNCHHILLHALDNNHYLYSGDNPHQINIDCNHNPTPIKLHKFHILHLPYQCTAYSETYMIPRFINDDIRQLIPPAPPCADENRLLQATIDNLAARFNHPVSVTKIKPLQGQLKKADFKGPIDRLYQRLHERLQLRIARDQRINASTFSSIWPMYVVAAIIALAAATALIILIYIARYAAPNEH